MIDGLDRTREPKSQKEVKDRKEEEEVHCESCIAVEQEPIWIEQAENRIKILEWEKVNGQLLRMKSVSRYLLMKKEEDVC